PCVLEAGGTVGVVIGNGTCLHIAAVDERTIRLPENHGSAVCMRPCTRPIDEEMAAPLDVVAPVHTRDGAVAAARPQLHAADGLEDDRTARRAAVGGIERGNVTLVRSGRRMRASQHSHYIAGSSGLISVRRGGLGGTPNRSTERTPR